MAKKSLDDYTHEQKQGWMLQKEAFQPNVGLFHNKLQWDATGCLCSDAPDLTEAGKGGVAANVQTVTFPCICH